MRTLFRRFDLLAPSQSKIYFRIGVIVAALILTLQIVGVALLPEVGQRVILNTVLELGGLVFGCLGATYASWQTRSQPRLARAWRVLTLGVLATLTGGLLAMLQALATGRVDRKRTRLNSSH